MSGQSLLNAVARVVGGTQPDNTHTTASAGSLTPPTSPDRRPYWFSGIDTGDGSGVAGLPGCWSLPLEQIGDVSPIAMVFPDTGSDLDAFPTQGHRRIETLIHVRVLTGHGDLMTNMAALVNFDDLVQAAFNTHMNLFGEAFVDTAWCSPGTHLEVAWPEGTVYNAIQFVVHVHRNIAVNYS